jgi:PAS domain S-box-containing protein
MQYAASPRNRMLTNPRLDGREAPIADLHDAADALAAVLAASPAAVVCVDRDGRVESWNAAAEIMLGWSAADAFGRPTAHVLADSDGSVSRLLMRILADLPVEEAETVVQRRDGGSAAVRLSAAPLRGDEGMPRGAVFVLVDVTGEHVANERLAYQAQLLANVREAIMAVDERLVITAWNHAAEEIYGWAAWEVVGRHVHDVLRTEFPGFDLAGAIRMLFENGGFSGEVRQRHRSGKTLAIEVRAAAVRDDHGRPAGFVMVNRDVTARREAEEIRARLEAELRQAQKMEALGQLAAGVAHDFNNLLTAIQGFGELLTARLGDDELRRDAEEVVRTAERGAALTRQLLAFSRRERSEPVHLDLSDLVNGVEALLRRTLAGQIDLRFSLAPTLPSVFADRGQLEQVLLNLSLNARDAMPGGGALTIVTDSVWLDMTAASRVNPELSAGRYVRLIVSDTGFGMSPEVKTRALEPFFTTKEPGKGTGLGLATVWGIATSTGGTVALESSEAVGTTVTVFLPAAEAPPVASLIATPEPRTYETTAKETVLLVEDEEAVRGLARRILEEQGYRVLPASDGAEALDLARLHAGLIDLLLTDVMLPSMTGAELAEQVSDLCPGVRALAMSGYACREAIETPGEGLALIAKPFRRETLLSRVRDALAAP